MTSIDVLCVGNAIVDIIGRCDDAFLKDNGVVKNAMNLIDAERADRLYGRMGPATETSGGSAGNTAAGIASFGGRAAFFGKVADDQFGTIFQHDIRAVGVAFDTSPLAAPPPTARSLIFVTPDGERSMNTFLGASLELGPDDVDAATVEASRLVYFEGYLWDPPRAKEAILECARIAHGSGGEVAMSLSDPFCVDRYRGEFIDLIGSGTVDIVFANEHELLSLYQIDDLAEGLARLRKDCRLAAVTRSAEGSIIVAGKETVPIAALAVDKVVDTTGAGDLYAAGFLYGYTQKWPLAVCGALGSLAAGLVIQQIGPRLAVSLAEAAIARGLFPKQTAQA